MLSILAINLRAERTRQNAGDLRTRQHNSCEADAVPSLLFFGGTQWLTAVPRYAIITSWDLRDTHIIIIPA